MGKSGSKNLPGRAGSNFFVVGRARARYIQREYALLGQVSAGRMDTVERSRPR